MYFDIAFRVNIFWVL